MSEIKVGDVVQIDPEHDDRFGGCFMQVEEVKGWGYCGFVTCPDEPTCAIAYYRVEHEHVVRIGKAEWVSKDIVKELQA